MKKYLDHIELANLVGLLITACLIWFGGPLLKVKGGTLFASIHIRIITIGLFFLLWLLKVGIRIFLDEHASKKIANKLAKEGVTLTSNQTLDKNVIKKSLLRLYQEIRKQSLKYGRKKAFFGEAPCFIITGLPASGKTFALAAADIRLSFVDAHLQKALKNLQSIANTRWWFTQEAIFLEMDIAEPLDSINNTTLLGALKQSRRGYPIDGIVIVEDINHLLSLEEIEYKQYANTLNHHLRSFYAFFGLHLPIYILFTKSDLIPGFREYFQSLNAEEREKVFGYNIEDSDPIFIQKKAENQHAILASQLENELLHHLSDAEDSYKAGLLITFPKQFLSLRPRLTTYLKDVFDFDEAEKPYILQGLYFSSAGSIDKAAENKDSLPSPGSLETSNKLMPEKNYFLKGFFKRQILLGVNQVNYNYYTQKIKNILRKFIYILSGSLILIYISASIQSYLKIKANTQRISSILNRYNSLVFQPLLPHKKEIVESLPNLDPLKEALSIYKSNLEWYQPYTIYEFHEIEEALQRTLFLAVDTIYIPYLFKRVEMLLERETVDLEKVLSLLKVYLEFGNSKRLEQSGIRSIATRDIKETYKDPQMIEKLLSYLEISMQRSFPIFSLDTSLIQKKQAFLGSLDPVKRAYKALQNQSSIHSVQPSIFPKTLESLIRSAFSFQESTIPIIPYFYTAQGYKEIFQKNAALTIDAVLQEDWFIGLKANEKLEISDKKVFLRRLEQMYAQDYLMYWQSFLAKLHLVPTHNINDLRSLLNILAGKEPLFLQLISFVNQQVQKILELEGTNSYEEILGFSRLNESKENDGVKAIVTQLNQLEKLLLSFSSSLNPDHAFFTFIKSLQEGGASLHHPLQTLMTNATLQPSIFRGWLVDIVGRIVTLSLHHSATYLDKAWKKEVYSFYEKNIKTAYPLVVSSKHNLELKNLKLFLEDKGILASFFEEAIKPLISAKELEIYPNQKASVIKTNHGTTISPHIIKGINTALSFYKEYVDEKGNLNLSFQLQPFTMDAALSSLSFEFSGASLSYRHGPLQRQNFEWKDPEQEADFCEISIIDFKAKENKISWEGPWALFKFLDSCYIKPYKDGKSYLLKIPLKKYQVQFLFQSSKAIGFLEGLRHIYLPDSLLTESEKKNN